MTFRSTVEQMCKDQRCRDALDELVHDCHDRAATRTNNEGLKDQLEYLESQGMTEDEIIEKLAEAADDRDE